MTFLTDSSEKIFTTLIKSLADEKIFPSELYYNIETETAVIEISASTEDIFNQIFGLTPEDIFHKVDKVCFNHGATEKEKKHFTTAYYINSEIKVIINK